jgi:C-methyltransferase
MSDPHAPQGPAALMQMFQAGYVSALLASGIQLGVFAALAEGPRSAAALAERIHCPERSTRVMLDGLGVIGLLKKDGDQYRLAPLAEDHLVPGKPMYMGDIAGIFASPMLWEGLANLSDAVKSGGTVRAEHAETPSNPFWETFATSSGSMAMGGSMALGGVLQDFLAARKTTKVLDIACGSGIYGYSLLKHPGVEVTLLDWPNVLPKTREWGARLGADMSRVKFLEGNLFEVDYGGPYDVILLSHVYHHFDSDTCLRLTRKVGGALAPGGRVLVQDFVSSPDLSNPAATLFSITMLMWTRKGEAFTADDYRRWFTQAGFKAPSLHASLGMPTSWLVAEKA